MKLLKAIFHSNNPKSARAQAASARLPLLTLGALLAGLAIGALVVYQATRPRRPVITPGSVVLSDGLKAVLARLHSPVELRFYSLCNPDSAPANVREAADRAGALLAEIERQANGKVNLTRVAEWSVANSRAAAADGLVPFNIEKGDAIYFGLLLKQDNRRQCLPQVLPAWAPALEFDLARAIEKLAVVENVPVPAADVARTTAAETAVKLAIPKASEVSFEDGRKVLQELAFKAFQATAQEMNQSIVDAEKRVLQAEATKSETEKPAALAQLQEVRTKYGEKLRELALQAQAQQEAWKRLKTP